MFIIVKYFVFIAILIIRTSCVRLVIYDRHINKSVNESSKSSLILLEPFKVNEIFKCLARCNIELDCVVVTLNASKYCSIFSSKITTLDFEAEHGTLTMAKKPIMPSMQYCIDSDYFVDMTEMKNTDYM